VSRVAVLAFGAVSALGEGARAVRAGEPGERAHTRITSDPELARAGLARPFAARVGARVGAVSSAVAGARLAVGHAVGHALADASDADDEDRRETALLVRALGGCVAELDAVRPSWRGERVGMVLGTSGGGMRSAERAFAALARGDAVVDVEGPTYFGPMAVAARWLGLPVAPAALLLGACASSSIAIGLAARWLEQGACDVALAGGFDDVTVFVAAGFEALRATTASPPPRPFRVGRDGMSLGEGAAVIALGRADASARAYMAYVAGFAAASDAVHLTAPDRTGGALGRAATAALREAGSPVVHLVGAHATATPFNDASESRAIVRALGEARAREVVVHPFKAQIGHTLGAAGALETLACLDAIARGVLPAAAGEGPLDPDAPARLLERTVAGRPRTALKLSSAFGGANAALVVTADAPDRPRAFRPAFVHEAVHVGGEPPLDELAALTGMTVDRLARADALVRLSLAAVAALQEGTGGALSAGRAGATGTGVVVGTALATVETNALFAARLRERGPGAAEPRRFPYTSPNAAPGECSIAFGLTGPSFSVGGGLHAAVEALAVASLLVEGGDADRVVVVAVDDVGPVTRALAGDAMRSGAVALLVSSEARSARARVGPVTLRRGAPAWVASAASAAPAPGHLALLPLVSLAGSDLPGAVEGVTPPDAFARVVLVRL
jgi:3-oxoacyl-[acyl-carrier-protein] synthase II